MTLLEKINSLTWYNNIVKLKEVLKELSTSAGSGSSGIVDAPAIAGSGTTIMTFDEVRCHGTTIQTGNIVLGLNPAIGVNKNLRRQVISINGNSVSTLTFLFPVSYVTTNIFDKTKNNVIYLDNVNGNINGTIINREITAPTLSYAQVQEFFPTQVAISFSEQVDINSVPSPSDFTLDSGRTITSLTMTSTNMYFIVSPPYDNYGTLTYTPGINKIKDLAGNEMVAFSNKTINFFI